MGRLCPIYSKLPALSCLGKRGPSVTIIFFLIVMGNLTNFKYLNIGNHLEIVCKKFYLGLTMPALTVTSQRPQAGEYGRFLTIQRYCDIFIQIWENTKY